MAQTVFVIHETWFQQDDSACQVLCQIKQCLIQSVDDHLSCSDQGFIVISRLNVCLLQNKALRDLI